MMKTCVNLIFLLTFLLLGQEGIIHEKSFVHNNTLRSYLLYVPNAYTGDASWPLVINYHGFSTSAQFQMNYSRMNAIADTAHFIIAYPQGLVVQDRVYEGSDLGWHVPGRWIANQDDVAFTDSIISHIQSDFKLDISRIHATGWSNGSEMAFYLACRRPEIFASVGGVSGSMIENLLDTCQVARPISIVLIHGTADPLVPIEGMEEIITPVARTASFWATSNNCLPDSIVANVEDSVKDDSCTVTLIKYFGCDNNTEVLFYRINNGGHSWPGAFAYPEMKHLGHVNQDISASSVIWNFFKNHPHPQPTVSVAKNDENMYPQIQLFSNYPNPFNPSTSIEYSITQPEHVRITMTDIRGRHIKILVSKQQNAGHFQTTWGGTDDGGIPVAAGFYFCRLHAGGYSKTIKMALVR